MCLLLLYRDLRDNHVKCDCQFYEYWKTLKGEGVEIHGECSDLSDKLSGLPFQELNEDSFACGKNTSFNKFNCPCLLP